MHVQPRSDPPRVDVGRLPVVRRLVAALVAFVAVVVGGVVGVMGTQDASFVDAAYFIVITVFAVGFTEVVQLDTVGRALISAVIVLGIGSFTFLTINVIEFLVEGHVLDIVGRRRMQRQIDELSGHMIVCGFGRVGRQTTDDLVRAGVPLVVIDPDVERLALVEDRGLPHVHGSAADEAVLAAARIDRAYGVAAVTQDDAANVLITLTAKLVRPDVFVVVRLKDARNTAQAQQAGANRVISPSEIGGHRIAALLTRPSVVDFLDVVTHGSDIDLVLEEIRLRDDAPIIGQTLVSAGIRDTYGANVVAIRVVGDVQATTRPDPNAPLEAGDVLVVMGSQRDLDRMQAVNGIPRR